MKGNFNTKNVCGIYVIQNDMNGKCYIGSSIDMLQRKKQHISTLKGNRSGCYKLQHAFNKYGKNNFTFDILEIVGNKDELFKREQRWVDFMNPEYNICKVIVKSRLGVKISDASKKKISDAQQGRILSKEALKNIRMAAELRKGIPLSKETKEKISISNSGKVRIEEYKKRTSELMKGKPFSEVGKAKLKEYYKTNSVWNKGMKMPSWIVEKSRQAQLKLGRKLSPEQRQQISDRNKGYKPTEEAKQKLRDRRKISHPCQRLVINIETGIFYKSIKEAHAAYGKKMKLTHFGGRMRGHELNETPFRFCDEDGNLFKYDKPSPEFKKPCHNSVVVMNLQNGIFYFSIKEAWKAYGRYSESNLGQKLRGERPNDTPFAYVN